MLASGSKVGRAAGFGVCNPGRAERTAGVPYMCWLNCSLLRRHAGNVAGWVSLYQPFC